VSSFSGGVVNTGQIQVGNYHAIDVANVGQFSGGISNTGTMMTGSQPIRVTSVSNFSGGLNNNGTVAATNLGSGIFVNAVADFSGGIQNGGTIIGTDGIGVCVDTTFMGAIVNSGTVNAMNAAINIAPNTIAINQTQTAGALNGDVVLSPFADVLTVSGCAINGDIVGQGPNIVNFALGDGSFTYGPTYAISAVDQINVNSGFVTLNGVNDADNVTVNGGTLAVGDAANSAAMLTAATGLTVGPGGTLMGFGTVIGNVGIASGATLSPGGSIGTMNVTGNLTIANGSFYVVEVSVVEIFETDGVLI
jgi:fibronectin-binding autotransporter adhesin